MRDKSETNKEVQQEGGETHLPMLIDEIHRKLEEVKEAEVDDLCIYKVPSKLRKVKEDAYDPRVISIGPFHRTNPDLAAMREHKWRHMLSFVQQTKVYEDSLNCLQMLTNAIYSKDDKVIRGCYAEEIEQNKNDLTKMMLLDGCFILELFLRHCPDFKYKKEEDGPDPILESSWMTASLRHDLALLENQIPFFILEALYGTIQPFVSKKCNPPPTVASLALTFFEPSLLSRRPIEGQVGEIKCKHLLDLLYKFCFFEFPAPGTSVTVRAPSVTVISIDNVDSASDTGRRSDGTDAPPKQETSSSCFLLSGTKGKLNSKKPKNSAQRFKKCASKMESGIKFETDKQNENHHLLNMSFKDGVLKIPQLRIDEMSSSLFRNLIAYEQCSLGSKHVVTAYVFLMMSLIRSARDSKLLQEKGIIHHTGIDDKEYLEQFQSISKEVVQKNKDGPDFGNVCDDVTQHLKSCNLSKFQVLLKVRCSRDIKLLYDTYFSSTWSFISFLAAVVLLVLTCVQTYYTVNPAS